MTEECAKTELADERPAVEGRTVGVAMAAVVVVSGFLMALQPIQTPDVWHHVKAGWLVWENGGPVRADVFSCTAQGKRWIQYEWLAQFLMYGIYELGGVTGLILFRAAGVAVVAFFLALAARRWGAGWTATAFGVMLALCAASGRFFARPEIFTWVIFAAWLFVIAEIRRGRHRLFFVPALLMVPWVNMHGAWIAGLAFLGLTCAGETLAFLLKLKHAPPKRTLQFLWIALGLASLLTFANPYGPSIWEVPMNLARSADVTKNIIEWQVPGVTHWLDARHAGAWLFLLALLMAPHKVRIGDALVVMLFGWMSFTAARHLSLAMLVTAPIFAKQLELVWGQATPVPRFRKSVWRAVLRVGVTVMICAVTVLLALGGFRLPRAGLGMNTKYYPIRATRFLEDNGLEGNLFNSYTFGNYLLFKRYPRNHVFIDGRVDMYGAEIIRLYDRVRLAKEGWQDVLAKHTIEIAVFQTSRDTDKTLTAAMHRSRDWALVYWDDNSAVYVKQTAAKKNFLDRTYQYEVRPAGLAKDLMESPEGLKRAERDYRHKLREDPECVLALWGLSGCLVRSGDLDEAEAVFRKMLRIGQYRAQAYHGLAFIYDMRDNPEQALEYARLVIRHGRPSWRDYLNLSVLYEKVGDVESAIDAMENVLRLLPNDPDTRKRLEALRRKRGTQP